MDSPPALVCCTYVRDERLVDGVEHNLEHAEPEELRRGDLAQEPAKGDEHGRHAEVALEERGEVDGGAGQLALEEPVPEVVVDDAPLQACVWGVVVECGVGGWV